MIHPRGSSRAFVNAPAAASCEPMSLSTPPGPNEEIVLPLTRVDQLVEPRADSPFLKRRLREDAEEFILERARALPRKASLKLLVLLPDGANPDADSIVEAVRQHFTFRRVEAEKAFRRTLRFGWLSLLIGLVFLSLALGLVGIVKRNLPTGNFSTTIEIGLAIMVWVALWRPGELLLYEWYPFKRDARLFRRLEDAEVRVLLGATDDKQARDAG